MSNDAIENITRLLAILMVDRTDRQIYAKEIQMLFELLTPTNREEVR